MFIYIWVRFIGCVAFLFNLFQELFTRFLRKALTSSLSESSDASSESDKAFLAFFFEGPSWEFESFSDSAFEICGTFRFNEASVMHVDVPGKRSTFFCSPWIVSHSLLGAIAWTPVVSRSFPSSGNNAFSSSFPLEKDLPSFSFFSFNSAFAITESLPHTDLACLRNLPWFLCDVDYDEVESCISPKETRFSLNTLFWKVAHDTFCIIFQCAFSMYIN